MFVRSLQWFIVTLLVCLLAETVQAQPNIPTPVVKATLNTDRLLAGSQHVIAVKIVIPNRFHAQSNTPTEGYEDVALKVTLDAAPAGVNVLTPVYPAGETHDYPNLGKLNIYEGTIVVFVPLSVDVNAAPATEIKLSGKVAYQLCDDGTCYQPSTEKFSLTTQLSPRDAQTTASDPELFKGFDWAAFASGNLPAAPPPSAKEDNLKVLGFRLTPDAYGIAFAGAFFVGLVFNLMPCVLPVLPLKAVGFIQAAEHSRSKAVLLGVTFSAGLIAVFAALGIFIFLGGQQWGFLFQSKIFVFGMSAVLVAMALGQWGLFTFRLPLGAYTYEPRHDTHSGSFMFGAFTALLSTPCTASFFPLLLLWAAAQPKLIGISLLVTVGVGMALPYFVLSCFPELARRVPRTGPWSEIFKQMMGFLILATAAYFAGQAIMPGMTWMWAVAVVAIAGSVFLIVRTARLMPRPVPIAVAAVLAVMMSGSSLYAANKLNQKPVEWTHYSDQALADARAGGKTVLVKFTANWCANCHYVEATVFTDSDVKSLLKKKDVVLLKVDLTKADAPGSELLKSLNPAGGIPLTAIYFPNQEKPTQLSSIYTATTLLQTLK